MLVQGKPPGMRLRYVRVDEVTKVDVALNVKPLEGGGIGVDPSAPPLFEVEPSEDSWAVIVGATGGEWRGVCPTMRVGGCTGDPTSATGLRGGGSPGSLVSATAGDSVFWGMGWGIGTASVASRGGDEGRGSFSVAPRDGEGMGSLPTSVAADWVHCGTGTGVGPG